MGTAGPYSTQLRASTPLARNCAEPSLSAWPTAPPSRCCKEAQQQTTFACDKCYTRPDETPKQSGGKPRAICRDATPGPTWCGQSHTEGARGACAPARHQSSGLFRDNLSSPRGACARCRAEHDIATMTKNPAAGPARARQMCPGRRMKSGPQRLARQGAGGSSTGKTPAPCSGARRAVPLQARPDEPRSWPALPDRSMSMRRSAPSANRLRLTAFS
jgi:hypothetical protein